MVAYILLPQKRKSKLAVGALRLDVSLLLWVNMSLLLAGEFPCHKVSHCILNSIPTYFSGSGAIGAIESLREKGFTGQITCLSRETYYPIDRTRLSKALVTDAQKLQWRDGEFFKNAGVDFKMGAVVTEVNFNDKKVKTEDGNEYSYTTIILATGGTPKMLPMEGFDLGNVFLLRGIDDAKAIVEAVGDKKDKKIVVIGSSFIGMITSYLQ